MTVIGEVKAYAVAIWWAQVVFPGFENPTGV
jgi:hypothetical protein